MMHDLEKEVRLATELAMQAADIVREVYASSFEVQFKDGNEPVTQADRRVNEWIVNRVAQAFPCDGIVAEESIGDTKDLSEQVFRQRVWFVDPLDGTKEFVSRNGQFSIMIGLAIAARPVMGVVAMPDTDELAVGVVGQGAWLITKGSERTALQVSSKNSLNSCTLVMSRSHVSERLLRMVTAVSPGYRLHSGSVGIKAVRIATQEADIYIHANETRGAKLWDGCAPEAIVLAAGGNCTDVFGNSINYATNTLALSRGLVFTNSVVHQAVINALQPIVGDSK